LPDIYDSLFSQNQRSGRVSLSSLNDLLSKGNITAYQIERVSKEKKRKGRYVHLIIINDRLCKWLCLMARRM
jgi:hypothetical protein